MVLARIMDGLRAAPKDAKAAELARLGFMEWSLSLSDMANPQAAARAALVRIGSQKGTSGAVDHFLGHLTQVANLPADFGTNAIRRGGAKARRARLH